MTERLNSTPIDRSSEAWIGFRKLVPALRDQLDRHLIAMVVAPKDGSDYRTLASGILVRRDGRSGILTAAHVARAIRSSLFGCNGYFPLLVASTKPPSEKSLDGKVVPIELRVRKDRLSIVGGEERGMLKPDIAWIPLPVSTCDELEAETIHRFYDWNPPDPPQPGIYCHFVSGCIGAHSRKLQSRLHVRAVLPEFRQVKCENISEPERRGEWDFITVMMFDQAILDNEERHRPGGVPEPVWETVDANPEDFRGVSGAPLWSVLQAEEGDSASDKLTTSLQGIAFNEFGSTSSGRVFLSCHGPESIERITSPDGGAT